MRMMVNRLDYLPRSYVLNHLHRSWNPTLRVQCEHSLWTRILNKNLLKSLSLVHRIDQRIFLMALIVEARILVEAGARGLNLFQLVNFDLIRIILHLTAHQMLAQNALGVMNS